MGIFVGILVGFCVGVIVGVFVDDNGTCDGGLIIADLHDVFHTFTECVSIQSLLYSAVIFNVR